MIDQKSYNDNGYVLLKGFFPPGEIAQLHQEAKDVFSAQILKRNPAADLSVESNFEQEMYKLFADDMDTIVNCGKQVQHLISLHRLGTDPRITQLLQSYGMSRPAISARPVMYFNSRQLAKKEDYWRLGAHQDWRSSQGSLDSMTIWIPLVDVDKSLGALEVIPGSHKWGLLTSEKVSYYGKISAELADDSFVPMEVKRGDALLFSSFLVHRSGTNSTSSIRWSCHLRYNNLDEKTFIERGYPHPFIYKPQEDLLTPGFPSDDLLQRLFG